MKVKIFFLTVISFFLALYLHQNYARIYNRSESILPSIAWNQPVLFKNSNFQNTAKYVALGDSLTVGFGSNDIAMTYPYFYAQNLSKQMSVLLTNFGVRGATSSDLINTQLGEAVREKPNYISLLIGINDVHNFTSEKKFKEDFDHITSVLIAQTDAKIILLNIPYLGSKNLILFPFNIYFDYKTRQFNGIISKIAKAKNLTLIDIYTPTKKIFSDEPDFYSSDGFHPSGEGYILWGNLLSGIK